MPLDKFQEKAANHISGPCLCIAGPGSGKTTTIVHRVANIINSGAIPERVLIVTFTKAAAESMKERYKKFQGDKYNKNRTPKFCTIHSFAFFIDKFAYNFTRDNIFSPQLSRKWMVSYLIELNNNGQKMFFKDIYKAAENILGEISRYKNTTNKQNFSPRYFSTEKLFLDMYNQYEFYKRQHGLLDFDDILFTCRDLLKRNDYLTYCQSLFDYIMIDEFQDTDVTQAEILYKIAAPRNNIFICGDDDQSIYKFRGADPTIMMNFEKIYPDCFTSYLSTNYRSDKNVIDEAKMLIDHNEVRFAKKIVGKSKNEGSCKFLQIDKNDYGKVIAEDIVMNKKNCSLKEMAILCRTNAQVSTIAKYLSDENVPFESTTPINNYYNSIAAKTILSYLNLVYDKGTDADYFYIINKPFRYIASSEITRANGSVDKFRQNIETEAPRIRSTIRHLDDDIRYIKIAIKKDNLKTIDAINMIFDIFDLKKGFIDTCKFMHLDVDDFLQVAKDIKGEAIFYPDIDSFFTHIEESKAKFEAGLSKKEQEDRVTISTMHKAKGLEWDIVYIPFVTEGNCPYYSENQDKEDLDADYIEEERRLFYVAVTRARKKVYIYADDNVSRFIKDMGLLKPHCKVTHCSPVTTKQKATIKKTPKKKPVAKYKKKEHKEVAYG